MELLRQGYAVPTQLSRSLPPPEVRIPARLDIREGTAETAYPPAPEGLRIQLKPHQRALLARCREMERGGVRVGDDMRYSTQHGILGDKVGSGKSVVVMALIADNRRSPPPPRRRLVRTFFGGSAYFVTTPPQTNGDGSDCEEEEEEEESDDGRRPRRQRDVAEEEREGQREGESGCHHRQRRRPALNVIVVPHSLVGQWQEVFERHGPEELLVGVVRSARQAEELRAETDAPRSTRGLNELDVLIVTSTFYWQVGRMLVDRSIPLRRLVIDEAHSIRIPKFIDPPRVRFTWFVTASYDRLFVGSIATTTMLSSETTHLGLLRRTPLDLWAFFMARCTDEFVDASFRLPEVVHHVVRCRASAAVNLLYNSVDARIMESLNAGDTEGAIQQLNPRAVHASENSIVGCQIARDLGVVRRLDSQLAVLDAMSEHSEQLLNERRGTRRARRDTRERGEQEQEERVEQTDQEQEQERGGARRPPPCRQSHEEEEDGREDDNDGQEEDEEEDEDEEEGGRGGGGGSGRDAVERTRRANEQLRAGLREKRDAAMRRVENIRARIIECDACSICYETIANKTVTSCCSNAFCFRCLQTWLAVRHVCPICKRPSSSDSVLLLAPPPPPPPARASISDPSCGERRDNPARDPRRCWEGKDKLQNFEALVRSIVMGEEGDSSAGGHGRRRGKLLVFSSHDGSFAPIEQVLRRLGVPSASLRGTGAHLDRVLREFRRTDVDSGDDGRDENDNDDAERQQQQQQQQRQQLRVLLLNATHFGSGLNLQDATDIVVFHRMSSDLEKQVIGRAQRPGRTEPLAVWHLLHDNELPRGIDNNNDSNNNSNNA